MSYKIPSGMDYELQNIIDDIDKRLTDNRQFAKDIAINIGKDMKTLNSQMARLAGYKQGEGIMTGISAWSDTPKTGTPVWSDAPFFFDIEPPHGILNIKHLYGNPIDYYEDGEINETKWREAILATIDTGWLMPLSFASMNTSKVTCHKLIAPLIEHIFNEHIKTGMIKNYGGCYNLRPKSSNKKELSIHSWGIAFDFNVGLKQNMDLVAVMKEHKFIWGGDWSVWTDSMHFQYCTGY